MRDIGLTLAGGGNRSFYQQGLLRAWDALIWPRVAAVACSSAGAAVALLELSGRAREARTLWDEQRRDILRNLDPTRLLRSVDLFPHGLILRNTMVHAFGGGGFERIRSQPFPIHVLCSAPPRGWPASLAIWVGIAAYELEKRIVEGLLHPKSGKYLGFRPYIVDARSCRNPEELTDLVLASSSMPPCVPVGRFRRRVLLDGGIVDNVPTFVAEQTSTVRRNLVLLTRVYPTRPADGTRLYIQPSAPVPVKRWDYRRSAPVDAAVELGRSDAEQLRPELARWLNGG